MSPPDEQPRLIEIIGHALLWARGTYETPQDAARALLKRLDHEGFHVVAKEPPSSVILCDECGKYPADFPSKLCPGCEAYRAHTGAA